MHSTNKAFERYYQTNSQDALDVFRLTKSGTQTEHGNGLRKGDKLLKLKVKKHGATCRS